MDRRADVDVKSGWKVGEPWVVFHCGEYNFTDAVSQGTLRCSGKDFRSY